MTEGLGHTRLGAHLTGACQDVTVLIHGVGCVVPPIARKERREFARTCIEGSCVIACRVFNEKIELGARNTACASWVGKGAPEKSLDPSLWHETQDPAARQREFSHSRHIESRWHAQYCGVEAGALVLAGDVENEVRLHEMSDESGSCVA